MYSNGLKSNFAKKYSMGGEFLLNTKRVSYQSGSGRDLNIENPKIDET